MATKRHPRPYPNLRAYREANGLTQREAAAKFGIKQAHWSKIELGRLRPNNTVAKRLMDEAGVPLEVLMGIEV